MIAAVTGPSGHVGANLVRHLIDEGWTVRALVHDEEKGIEGLAIERFNGDLLHRESLDKCFRGADVVFNLAGRISIEGDPGGHVHRTNVEGTKNVVEACLACKVKKLVHFSSIHAFNPIPLDEEVDESRSEDDRPTTAHYNRSKAEGEHEVRKGIDKGLNAVILNPASIIGPYDFAPSLMGETFLKLYHGELTALSAGGFDFVDVRDVCQAAIAAVDHGKKGENYLISGQWLSVKELAQKVKKVKGVKAPRIALPFSFLYSILPFV
ncbi:MAG: NAD-dependent epimerase [Bacteroidetes bacterium SW_11_45_7]|nr:MAG: NAD-dependent epimerase [Bacteroidetes bacterium SW_11_45_7]